MSKYEKINKNIIYLKNFKLKIFFFLYKKNYLFYFFSCPMAYLSFNNITITEFIYFFCA